MPRRKDEAVEEPMVVEKKPKPRAKAVTAIFQPDGNIRVNLMTPNGRAYHIEPREPFEIAGEDVGWFFHEWDWQYRQRLTRVEDYTPPAGYFDATPDGTVKAPPGRGGCPAATPSTPPAPSAEYHDEGDTSTVITPEEREAGWWGVPKIEETDPPGEEAVGSDGHGVLGTA